MKRLLIFIVMVILLALSFSIAQVAWVKSLDVALKQAAREKKFVVLDISASW